MPPTVPIVYYQDEVMDSPSRSPKSKAMRACKWPPAHCLGKNHIPATKSATTALYPECVVIKQYGHHPLAKDSSSEAHRYNGTTAIDKQNHTTADAYTVASVGFQICLSRSAAISYHSYLKIIHILDLCYKDRLKIFHVSVNVSKSTSLGLICIYITPSLSCIFVIDI